jgi:hypothetical protein
VILIVGDCERAAAFCGRFGFRERAVHLDAGGHPDRRGETVSRRGCQMSWLTSGSMARTVGVMAGTSRGRDVFPLRFKRAATRDALRHLAAETGQSMTDIAETAIEHELALQGADLEERLTAALDVVRQYVATGRDARPYIEAAAAGERLGLEPFRHARGQAQARTASRNSDPFGVMAAFGQG